MCESMFVFPETFDRQLKANDLPLERVVVKLNIFVSVCLFACQNKMKVKKTDIIELKLCV